MKKILLISIVALLSSGCIPTNLTPINTVSTEIDLNRYLGKWYQIAALPQFFSFNAKCVTAEYSLNSDGSVKVVNKQITQNGAPQEIIGKATVEPNSGNAKLRVGFFGQQPTASNYWIVEIADDYSYAVVSDPNKVTWWILSRTPQMDETKVQEIIDRWAGYGINMSLLQRTVQDC
ncbi:MAG TPA: lipocalin family protein [Chitinophagales bacterium]|nr:lipocalin family protein [Chitinophagales bacterium]